MRRLGLLAVALLIVGLAAPQAQSKDPGIQKLADDFAAAWNKGDAKAIAALHTRDAIRIAPDAQVSVGQAAIEKAFAEALTGSYKGSTLVIKSGQERNVTADVVIGSGTWEVTAAQPQPGVPMSGTYLNTLHRQGGRWLVASSAAVGTPPKPKM